MKRLAYVAALFLAGAAENTAAQQAQPPIQQAQPPIQQQFDAATAALEAENWPEALRLLEALERQVARTGNARSLGVVRVRKAQALIPLGRFDEALVALRSGLAALPADDASLNEDRFRSLVALGRLAEIGLDYREAAQHYREAASIDVPPSLKLAVYRGLVQTLMFHDAPAALAAADEGIRLLAQVAPDQPQLEGQFRTSRGRVLLNMGRFVEARDELERATRRLGGLGLTVDLRDIVARSDLSIASLLGGNDEAARRYLALTGAGRMRESALPSHGRMPPARCGNGLSPSDVAVVELAIRDDGSVASAAPVYASMQGESALALARAALAWSWSPEQVSGVEPLFRAAVRVEMRCTLAPPPPEELDDAGVAATRAWAAGQGIRIEPVPSRNVAIPRMHADLAAAEARHGTQSPYLMMSLMRLGMRDEVEPRERAAFLRRALSIAITARAPTAYLATIAQSLAQSEHEAAGGGRDTPADYLALLSDPAVAANGPLVFELHLAAARALYAAERFDQAAAVLARAGPATQDPRYDDLVAAVEAARGNADAAAAALRNAPGGVGPCLTRPRVRSGRGTNSDFPTEALRWGFEGWTAGEALVRSDGTPTAVRTTIAYPPFVFDRGSENIIGRLRFYPVYENGGGPCATYTQRVIYRLPDR